MFSGIGGALSALAQNRANERYTQARAAMADMRELNELQSAYRGWVKMPRFVKYGGRWFAEVWYPPSVPRVTKRNR